MNVYVNSVTGIEDAVVALRMSKRTWTRELEDKIRNDFASCFDRNGRAVVIKHANVGKTEDMMNESERYAKLDKLISQVFNIGKKHITLLRFVDISITVEGLHRGGQDDWDSHAKRFENRIIRSSTRLATFDYEMSDYYKGKIIPTDMALAVLGLSVPNKIEYEGKTYVKTVNGYILESEKDNNDVKRGLYMLSIPSNFIFKVNVCELAHVYKMRNIDSTANPEVKECAEAIMNQLSEFLLGQITRDFLLEVEN